MLRVLRVLAVRVGPAAKDDPAHGAVHVNRFTTTCQNSRKPEVHPERGERAGNAEYERQVVHHDHHDVDRELRSDGCVRLKVHGAVQVVAQRERARIRHCHCRRKRNPERRMKTRKEYQVDTEREAVDQCEAENGWSHDCLKSERQTRHNRDAQPVKALGKARSARKRFDPHVATVPWSGIRYVSSRRTPGCAAAGVVRNRCSATVLARSLNG